MFGENPKLGPDWGEGTSLKVVKIFSTIQGEGPFVGVPAVFVRLGGCNLACNFCDTEFDIFTEMSLTKIMDQIKNSPSKLIVITGGEPFRQPIGELCNLLITAGYMVQTETNGTLYRSIPNEVHIVCSPKSIHGAYYYPHSDLIPHIDAYKFIISKTLEGYTSLPTRMLSSIPPDKIYLQPMDQYDVDKNAANLEYTIKLCIQYGYKLSMQIHKIANIE